MKNVRNGQHVPTSTVGRGKRISSSVSPDSTEFRSAKVRLFCGDSLEFYKAWSTPTVIVSDGAYGILGFVGDTPDHLGIAEWYEPHVAAWSKKANGQTTLWFWNSEIGWASVHPVLERHGWRYVNANIWNKGKAHIAGNVNTAKIRRFPVATEVCAHYVFDPKIDGLTLQRWLFREWKRTGLTMRRANEACGVRDVAVRKYLDQGHLWYYPPPEMFQRLADYANAHGAASGRPYFSADGAKPMSAADWTKYRAKFKCPVGYTNVWDRLPLKGSERVKVTPNGGRAAHLNQKPLDLMRLIIEASSDENDVVWEPFGGLFSASVVAEQLDRFAFGAEIDPDYFQLGISRFANLNSLF